MDIKLRVGIIATGDDTLNKEVPRNLLNLALKVIDGLNIDKIVFDEPISNNTIARNAGIYFSEKNIDLCLVIAGTWTQDNFLINALKFTNCPVVFWSPPDLGDNRSIAVGTLVGTMQNGGVLTKIGKKVKIITEDFDSEEGLLKLSRILKITETIKKLKLLRVGVIGDRCPGMLDTSFHELEMMRQIGPEVEHISMVEVLNELKNLNGTKKSTGELINLKQVMDVPDNVLKESINIYLAIKKLVGKYDLGALAVRCWPDFKDCGMVSPCFSLSRLSDENIVSACEADTAGAISMYILSQLTGNKVYLGDLLRVDNDTGEACYYHCGAAATALAKTEEEVIYRLHRDAGPGRAWNAGVAVEFPLKPGRVTFARIGEVRGKYRIVSYRGNAVETGMFTIGNPAKVILDSKPGDLLNKLIENGAGHHHIGVHGDVIEDLKALCDMLDIDLILI
ncbi:MAG: hypothetical protein JW770_01095 [Actinobacteria bacterium]|nr:hypothetical protein [Actinomycetota bacterium]